MTKHAFGVPSVALSLAGGIVAIAALASLAPDGGVAAASARGGIQARQAVLPTRIEVDNRTNAIRFYVSGTQVAKLDSLGLQQAPSE